ncbi:MAG: PEP-CTERM sorting domain-containing protein [Burkholderiales bacterium]|nr:PEP-CTERM sorting domain-containing protein [Burkholderiales bacterium]MBK9346963.1 PEP-CTERM sorting domain-containing protein [Burkholderiales bacterium]
MNKRALNAALAIACSFFAVHSANAADQYIFGYSVFNSGNQVTVNGSTSLNLVDSGWYFQNGTHNPTNQNYIVGSCTSCGNSGEYRNWFVFDIHGLNTPVTSATFSLYSYSVTLTSGNYYLNDVDTPISSLVAGTGGVAAFNDLGSGSGYGYSFFQSATDSNQFRAISLNSNAISSLNASIKAGASQWALGGAFQAGNVPVPQVPEPESYAMLLAGLGVMGAVARRRKAKQA